MVTQYLLTITVMNLINMRFFVFTKRDREVLQAELDGNLDKENTKDALLLAVLKSRIRENQASILSDVDMMEKIATKFNLSSSKVVRALES